MSIQSEIERIKLNVISAFEKVASKGGTVPANQTVENLPSAIESISVGVDTSDADATANDIVSPKTAYVGGKKITGTLSEITSNYGYWASTYIWNANEGLQARLSRSARTLIGANVTFWITVRKANFGDATTADVVTGKTFTSENGLKLTGTAKTILMIPTIKVTITNNRPNAVTVYYCYAYNNSMLATKNVSVAAGTSEIFDIPTYSLVALAFRLNVNVKPTFTDCNYLYGFGSNPAPVLVFQTRAIDCSVIIQST